MPRIRAPAVLVVVLMAMTAAPAFGQTLPDVQPSAPSKVQVAQRDGRWYLGFDTETTNVGPGTLRIQGQGDGSGVMTAWQLLDDGTQVDGVGTLKYVDGITHRHWHFMDFVRYELRGIDHPAVLRDQKQGFCLDDEAWFVPGTWCARDEPARTTMELGLVPGGRDLYRANVEGQEIPIDPVSAPAGRYLLSARIGPTGVIRETRTDNNVASTVVRLTWPTGGAQPQPQPIHSCVGRRCTKTLPAPRAAVARALARKALRRTLGRGNARGGRVKCTVYREREHACRVRLRRGQVSFRGSVRVWYVIAPSATRWYYTVKVVRRVSGCGDPCTRTIRRTKRLGGNVAGTRTASASRVSGISLLCRF